MVRPVLAVDGEALEAERESQRVADRVRLGILEYINQYATCPSRFAEGFSVPLMRAQARLLRLAFFPTRDELSVLGGLVHTEGHAKNWARRLVMSESTTSGIGSPKNWLSGLQSPWRGGYVAETGGRVVSGCYFLIECILVMCPRLHRFVREHTRRVVGLPPR